MPVPWPLIVIIGMSKGPGYTRDAFDRKIAISCFIQHLGEKYVFHSAGRMAHLRVIMVHSGSSGCCKRRSVVL